MTKRIIKKRTIRKALAVVMITSLCMSQITVGSFGAEISTDTVSTPAGNVEVTVTTEVTTTETNENGNKTESGNFVTLELTRGVTQSADYNDTARYSVDGAATGHYDDGNLKFWRYDINYTVVQNAEVGGVKLDNFVQYEIKDAQLDKFDLTSFTGSNGLYIN